MASATMHEGKRQKLVRDQHRLPYQLVYLEVNKSLDKYNLLQNQRYMYTLWTRAYEFTVAYLE